MACISNYQYLHGPAVDQLLAQENLTVSASEPERVLWQLTDALGSVRALADHAGALASYHDRTGRHEARFDYDPFGAPTTATLALAAHFSTRYLFTSREYDFVTGEQFNRARYYDPQAKRWLSEDPIWDDQVNTYRYVGNGPTNAIDPSGLEGVAGPPLPSYSPEVLAQQAVAAQMASELQGLELLQRLDGTPGPTGVNPFWLQEMQQGVSLHKQLMNHPSLAGDAYRADAAAAQQAWERQAQMEAALRRQEEYYRRHRIEPRFHSAEQEAVHHAVEASRRHQQRLEAQGYDPRWAALSGLLRGLQPLLGKAGQDFAGGYAVVRSQNQNCPVHQIPFRNYADRPGTKAPTAKGVGKYDIGPYDQMKGQVPGLNAHHVGQQAAMKKLVPGYDPATAPTILVPKVGHTIKGPNGIVSRNAEGLNSARDVIARDINELRRVYPDIPNSKLQELIQMNKTLYPSSMSK